MIGAEGKPAMRWSLDPRIAWQTVGGEAVVLDVVSGKAIGLNPTGSFIWTRIAEKDESDIAREMAREFGVDLAQAEKDVRAFLQDLEERGIVKRAGG